jgi:hypothetical protein
MSWLNRSLLMDAVFILTHFGELHVFAMLQAFLEAIPARPHLL